LTIHVKEINKQSLEQIRAFLESSEELRFQGQGRKEVYAWITRTLREQGYERQNRAGKGLLRKYVGKMTGRSRAQITRLIGRYQQAGEIQERPGRRHRFARRYTGRDVELLAELDGAHETLSGPATRRILQRELAEFGRPDYERLAGISVSHLYRLRRRRAYRQQRLRYSKTRPAAVSIGERRRPNPQGRPGYLRVDTVHQGDREDGVRGLYHINAVDEVTQWQIVGAAACISQAGLEPVLEAMLRQIPFRIRGFHSDNGSEFINETVEKLLNKLLIEQTKSRPRRSNDNGLVESKNGAVIRKHIGYGYIAASEAEGFQSFYRQHLNPYLNFHRPSGQPELVTDAKGRQKRIYRRYQTPWEVLQAIPQAADYLQPGQSLQALQSQAQAQSDTDAARAMQQAKRKLFEGFQREKRGA
jgi:transposase InsO family protein